MSRPVWINGGFNGGDGLSWDDFFCHKPMIGGGGGGVQSIDIHSSNQVDIHPSHSPLCMEVVADHQKASAWKMTNTS